MEEIVKEVSGLVQGKFLLRDLKKTLTRVINGEPSQGEIEWKRKEAKL